MIPSVINLRIQSGSTFRLRLWLPVFIVWPVVLALFLILLPFLLIAELVLRIIGARIFLFRMLGGILSVLGSLSGTVVKINSVKENSVVNVSVH